ncbi:MAG: bifunctional 2-keto-4-hydroxyglutarate aldolase/2-keto-3-deoxy-6-phosphogluconate aldolase [Gemmatales bacterium]|nr:bifunctional 2-keto-4-hydroxyglutarate aldolase/2-keto-3-deoxy-6-phosphogluconate aldolase [Gemmatales bacterium]MDW7993533.1 bifunctional 2-keto-4-hydroxyglutarate aldolase/2-keto-3-deoxy-6-phosphogluconate aldolase [Gemmatales bacterium]
MSQETILRLLGETKIVAIVRSPTSAELVRVARALLEGGIRAIEVTFTVPDAINVLRDIARELGEEVLLGAGTVLDEVTARSAILAGAQFIVAPNTNLEVIRTCRRYAKVAIPGAFTPTEIVHAWEAGADIVKVFPAEVGGPSYIRAVRAPLPHIRLMPTGGVNLQTVGEFLKAGAYCLGVGAQLVEPRALADGNFSRITELARQYVSLVKQYSDATASL